MNQTFAQIYVHVIFSTKNRAPDIPHDFQESLNRYISTLLNNNGCKTLIVNGTSDHIHLFFSLNPDKKVSELIKGIKQSSTNFINSTGIISGKFNWQNGYGAFTYSKSQIEEVYQYIKNQQKHHHNKTFQEEYDEFVKLFS